MSTFTPFECFSAFGVCERQGYKVTGYYSPSFSDRTAAELFATWVADWRRTSAFDPSVDEQEKIADQIREFSATFLAPILDIDPRDVMSDDEIILDFKAWQYERRAA